MKALFKLKVKAAKVAAKTKTREKENLAIGNVLGAVQASLHLSASVSSVVNKSQQD